MFSKQELNYILIAINSMAVGNTQEARNKAFMMNKVSDLLDQPEPEAEPEAEPKESAKKK